MDEILQHPPNQLLPKPPIQYPQTIHTNGVIMYSMPTIPNVQCSRTAPFLKSSPPTGGLSRQNSQPVSVTSNTTPTMTSPMSQPNSSSYRISRFRLDLQIYIDPDSLDQEDPEEGVEYPEPELFNYKTTVMTEWDFELLRQEKLGVPAKLMSVPDAHAAPSKIVDFLMLNRVIKEHELAQLNSYRTKKNQLSLNHMKDSLDREFDQKACESLVKKLKDKKHDLQNLIDVVHTKGHKYAGCIAIPRTLDGRLQVNGKKGFPHVVYGKLWRYVEMTKNEIRHVSHCIHAFEMKTDMVCVNPYHYEVVIGTTISGQHVDLEQYYTDNTARSPPRMLPPNVPLPQNPIMSPIYWQESRRVSRESVIIPPPIDFDRCVRDVFNMNAPLDQSPGTLEMTAPPPAETAMTLTKFRDYFNKQFRTKPSPCEPPDDPKPSDMEGVEEIEPETDEQESIDSKYHEICKFVMSLGTGTSDSLTGYGDGEQDSMDGSKTWGIVYYYEHEKFIGQKKCTRGDFHVDGGFLASDSRYSLGLEENLERTPIAFKIRKAIIDGIRISYKRDGSVWIQNNMKFPIFITSGYLDEQCGGHESEIVHKIYGFGKVKVFGLPIIKEVIKDQLYATHVSRKFLMGQPTEMDEVLKKVDPVLVQREANRTQADVVKYGRVRLSFLKGFGDAYPKQKAISDCPVWLEVKINIAFDYMETVWSALCSHSESE